MSELRVRQSVDPEDYESPVMNLFVKQCLDAGLEPYHYHGQFYYKGPAVDVSDIQDAIRATSVKVQWDNMGLDYVVYPRSPQPFPDNVCYDCFEELVEDECPVCCIEEVG